MRKITTIEKDCFYMWLNKPKDPKAHLKVREILIGDSVGTKLKDKGIVKFKKFFHKDLKKERSVAYRLQNTFKKEKDSRWFVISKAEIRKPVGADVFELITVIDSKQFFNTKGRRPLRGKHYFYIITF